MILGACELFFADRRFFHGAKFFDGEVNDLADGFLRGAGVDGEHASVGIGRELAKDGVGEALFFADVLKEARRHAASKKIVEDRRGEARFVAERKCGDSDTEMDLLEVALGFETNRRLCKRSGVIFQRARRAQIAELTLDEVQNFFMRDIPRGGDNEMIGRKPVAEALNEMSAVEAANGFWRSENRTAEWMLGPEAARENVVKQIFGIVQVHLDFFEDDLALLLDVIGIELGTENEIGDDVKGDREMFVENFGVEANLFFRSEGVEHAADGVHFASDGFGGAAFGALEDHVFDEMG